MRHLLVAVAALALTALAFACTEETIVLATVPTDDGGAGEKGWPKRQRCVTNADCDTGLFCERHDCDDAAGTCEPYPVSCDPEEKPVCGCNGITYWNDCQRRIAGVVAAHQEECIDGPACDDIGRKCPSGALCAKLTGTGDGGPPCHPPVGRCWVLPDDCPPPTRPDRWDECAPPDDKALRCIDTCTAIRTERPFVRASSCNP